MMRKPTPAQAVITLMREFKTEKITNAGAMRATKACRTLDLSETDTIAILCWMEFCNENGEPYRADIHPHWRSLKPTKKDAAK